MSIYDPTDGYEPCVLCSELTRNIDRVCSICNGEIPTQPKRKRRYRDPATAPRNHRQGHGWKANHES